MGKEVNRIREGMEKFHISYRDMERATGIGYSVIYRYLNGVTDKIPMDAIEKMAAAVHTTPEHIMGWDDALTEKDNELLAKRKILYDLTDMASEEELDKCISLLKVMLNK